jgi:single-strand DNA-binding protein
MDLNRAMLIGNVTRDPEMRTTPNGQNVCNFSIATNRRWKDQASGELKESTEFHNLVAWGKLAQTCSTYLKKGAKVYLEGRLQTRSWEDQTGVKKYRTEVVLDSMIMLDRKGAAPASNVPEAPADAGETPPQQTEGQEAEIKVEDIPF